MRALISKVLTGQMFTSLRATQPALGDVDENGWPRHRLVEGYDNMCTHDCPGCIAWSERMIAWHAANVPTPTHRKGE